MQSEACPARNAVKRESSGNPLFAWILRPTTVCPTYTQKEEKLNIYPGVAQLGARVVWDHQAAGSIPVTRTKHEQSEPPSNRRRVRIFSLGRLSQFQLKNKWRLSAFLCLLRHRIQYYSQNTQINPFVCISPRKNGKVYSRKCTEVIPCSNTKKCFFIPWQ